MFKFFEKQKERFFDRSRCLKCQKKLVGTEKWFCENCKQELKIGGGVLGGGMGMFLIKNFLRNKKED